jgi:dipeptidyl aminopeptidase/acylaminoacyl peptidase
MKKTIFSVILLFILVTGLAFTQAPYKLPPQEVVDIVTAPPPPRSSISPDGQTMLLIEYEAMPSIAYMAQPLHRIAGLRILPKYNARQTTTFYTRIIIQKIKESTSIEVELPDNAKLGFPRWSHDSKWFAFINYGENGIELWAVEAKTGLAKVLTGEIINATLNSGFTLLPDNRKILAFTTLEDRGAPPPEPEVPKGPNIQQTSGKFAKVWTYQDLLQSAYDESLFDYFATSQILEIDVETGDSKKIGPPGIYQYADPSPDGKFLLVYKIKRPYSYMVPYFRFPHSLEIWNRDGKIVHTLAHLPLADEVPMRGVAKGIRDIEWRALKPSTLVWIEALDEGDPEIDVPYRDKLMTVSAPFKQEPKEIMKIEHRYSGISWLQSEGLSFLTEYDWKRRWRTTYLINVNQPSIEPKKIIDISIHDRYNDPGRPVYKITSEGEAVIIQDKDWVYLSGSGASPQGDRPFLD